MSASATARPPWVATLLLIASLIPGLIAVLPLTLGAGWYLSDDGNAEFLTPARVWVELSLFTIAVAPFLAAAVALGSVLMVNRDWVKACGVAAKWALGLGVVAVLATGISSGGF